MILNNQILKKIINIIANIVINNKLSIIDLTKTNIYSKITMSMYNKIGV